MNYEELVQKLPGVMPPIRRLTFKEKLKWTATGIVLYFVMSQITVWGVSRVALEQFKTLEAIMGASFGSIITLGIGPIVTASILLQLLVGARVIGWDLSTQHGKIMFQGTQKILAIVLSVVEAAAYVMTGAIQPANFAPLTIGLVIFQIALGGWIILFLDEVISKWGLMSGVSLFIAAGVSKQIFVTLFNPLTTAGELPIAGEGPAGMLPHFLTTITGGMPDLSLLLPLVPTLMVFAIVVYGNSMRVEIPLAFGSVRGFGRKWPLKFIYTSNLPVILVAALLINVQLWAKLLADRGLPLLGTFSRDGAPLTGLVHYLNPPRDFIWNVIHLNIIPDDVLRVLVYGTFMILGSVMFSVFWVKTASMDARSVARQIDASGMQIPGFRRDVRIVETVLNRYIPGLAVLGGAFVGFLAAFADFTGAVVGGTSILLAVMIVYQLYETIATQHIEDMYPGLRKFIERT